jgi:hypothetical protein
LNADGSLDTSFNATGYVTLKSIFGLNEIAWNRSAVLGSDTVLVHTNAFGGPGRLIKFAPRLGDGSLIASGDEGTTSFPSSPRAPTSS